MAAVGGWSKVHIPSSARGAAGWTAVRSAATARREAGYLKCVILISSSSTGGTLHRARFSWDERKARGFPGRGSSGDLADVGQPVPLQQADGDRRPIAAGAVNEQRT